MTLRKLFRKSKPADSLPSKEPGAISKWLVGQLQSMDQNLSRNQRITVLVMFTIIGSACCVAVALRPFQKHSVHMQIGSKMIISPLPAYREDNRANDWLLEYSHYLDSLKHDTAGIRIYNKMRVMRPGLIDSIEYAGRLLNEKNIDK